MRENQSIQKKLQDFGQPVSGEQLVEFGKGAGFDYTQDELQTAFKHDWVMRALHYGRFGNSKEDKSMIL
jgi:Nif11 domain